MKLVAKTLFGLEEVLARELESIGGKDVKPANRAVFFTGNKALLYRSNYCLRTALSVLLPVAEFFIRSGDDLYKRTAETDWSEMMNTDSTFFRCPCRKFKTVCPYRVSGSDCQGCHRRSIQKNERKKAVSRYR